LLDWLGTISVKGWIPREQHRGDELRSYIPWLVENENEANPPTLMYGLAYLASLEKSEYLNKLK